MISDSIIYQGRMQREQTILDQLKEAIQGTVAQFRTSPYDFLSERDIQALLFAELRKATKDLRYQYHAGGANHRFRFPQNTFDIRPVTTEYYVRQGKIDVAVLSEPDPDSDIWRQPCRVAIEIKFWQPGCKEPGYMKDVEKLQRYQADLQKAERELTGVAMLFVHPCVTKDLEKESGDAYPQNGVALHVVSQDGHWWRQFPAPSVQE